MPLTTDWEKVATAGPTVDGRNIPEQDIQDIADTYDADEYTAVIWSSDPYGHSRWYGNFGQVREVKAEKDSKDRLCLFAKLQPNRRLIETNTNGQKLFTSIEIFDDFAGTGKAYLGGIAVTDEPASVGTSALKLFSKATPNNVYPTSESFSLSSPTGKNTDDQNTDSATDDAAKDGLITRITSAVASALGGKEFSTHVEQPSEDDEMKPEQFEQLLAAQQQTNTLLTQHFSKLQEQQEGGGDPNADDTDSDNQGNDSQDSGTGVTAEQFQALIDGQTKMTEQFSKLLEENPGTPAPRGAGDADESEKAVL